MHIRKMKEEVEKAVERVERVARSPRLSTDELTELERVAADLRRLVQPEERRARRANLRPTVELSARRLVDEARRYFGGGIL